MGKQALLLMDLQSGIVDRVSSVGKDCTTLLEATATTAAAARAAGVPVIYVNMSLRRGYPDISPRNASFARIKGMGGWAEGDAALENDARVKPHLDDGDIICTKRRVSAFAGSDLEVVLRSLGVDSLVLAGIATSGVVLSTVRQAADLDFVMTVLSDLCMDLDDEVHRVLMDKVISKQATVVTSSEWAAGLKSS